MEVVNSCHCLGALGFLLLYYFPSVSTTTLGSKNYYAPLIVREQKLREDE